MVSKSKHSIWYSAGDIVQVTVYGVIAHEGIVTEHGRVISNSRRRGGVYEESLRDFSGGRKIINKGPLKRALPLTALSRARSRLGQSYDVVNDNCQHFVRWCYGLRPYSPQKRLALAGGAVLALMAIF